MIDYTKKDDSKLTPKQAFIGTVIMSILVFLIFYGFYNFYIDMEKAQNKSYVTPVKTGYQIKMGTRMLVKPLNIHKSNHGMTQEVVEVRVIEITDDNDKYMKLVDDTNNVRIWKRYSDITIVKVVEE